MRLKYRWVMLLLTIVFLQACSSLPLKSSIPRLRVESVLYGSTTRQPAGADQFISIYNSREDVPYRNVAVGEVTVSPMHFEDNMDLAPAVSDPIEYDPIGLLRRQAKEMGGTGLVNVKRGTEKGAKYVWTGVVIGK
ncbi:MAG: hypothetical protein IME99_05980 [Proteobacteria bacterium]|nr:hypothetical protein [Pseudomonadota bacterium]